MTKGPVIKFPRIEAGFYSITLDGALVGYIKKEVDGKETNWWVYDTVDMDFSSETAIDTANELFREAKVDATAYFLSKNVEVAEVKAPVEVPTPAPVMEQPVVEEDFFDALSAFEDVEGEFEDAVFEYEEEPALV
jgi:hypothetical protein